MSEVECTSTVKAEGDGHLTAGAVASWVAGLPGDAKVTHLTRDIGNQRDPWIVLVGLKATWKEKR